MKKKYLLYSLVSLLLLSGCYDREEKIAAPIVGELSDLQYKVDDDTLRVSWNLPSHNDDLQVRVSGTDGTFVVTGNPTSYKYGVIKVGKDYRLTFKVIDSNGNYSTGQTISFTREGGASVQDVIAQQVDGTNNIQIKWVLPNEKLSKVEVRYDNKKIELKGDAVNYTIENAANKKYTIGVVSFNEEGQSSESVYTDIRVGKTKVAFLGVTPTRDGITDDDEKAAADWFFNNYPTGEYLSFDEIANGADLSQYRVLWWIRDSQQTTDLPAESLDPSVVEAIKKFHIDGGGLLLNTHAVAYLYTIGRMKAKFNTEFTSGDGFDNGDTWNMNVYIGKAHDETSHPIYRGLEWKWMDGKKVIPLIGAGWKENHNSIYKDLCMYYNMNNTDENAYVKISEDSQIRILATWDGINDYFMMANYETLPTEEFKGTAIAIGIGAFEWNQNRSVNPYQKNIEQTTHNAIEYLKTK